MSVPHVETECLNVVEELADLGAAGGGVIHQTDVGLLLLVAGCRAVKPGAVLRHDHWHGQGSVHAHVNEDPCAHPREV